MTETAWRFSPGRVVLVSKHTYGQPVRPSHGVKAEFLVSDLLTFADLNFRNNLSSQEFRHILDSVSLDEGKPGRINFLFLLTTIHHDSCIRKSAWILRHSIWKLLYRSASSRKINFSCLVLNFHAWSQRTCQCSLGYQYRSSQGEISSFWSKKCIRVSNSSSALKITKQKPGLSSRTEIMPNGNKLSVCPVLRAPPLLYSNLTIKER